MNKENQEWEKRYSQIANINLNSLTEAGTPICDMDIKFLEIKEFIKSELSKAREEERKKFQTIIKLRLKYCREQNGLPYCKNCGLKETDAIKEMEK